MKSRAAGFSKDRISNLFYLSKIIVEYKLNTAGTYVHKVYETAMIKFKKNFKSDTEKRNIVNLATFKYEERNQYNNRPMCQRCWLILTSYADTNNGMLRLQRPGTDRIFSGIHLRYQLCQQRTQLHKINITVR